MPSPVGRKHLVIPDTQVKTGVPTEHLTWIGRYILDKRPNVVIHLGDHWDMESLSTYASRRELEGKRYWTDIRAGNAGIDRLMAPITEYNRRRAKWKEKQYKPELHFTLGNHEERIQRAINENPSLEESWGYHCFNLKQYGWNVHDYLRPVVIDGISYAHFFYQPLTGRPYSGTAHVKLRNIGHSFVMGHVQGFDIATRTLDNGLMQWGLVAGSCYLHDEEYKGPQANGHWRGVVMLHEVRDGNCNPMVVSLDYLKQRYG